MFKIGSKYTIYIVLGLVVVGILVFVYFVGRRSAKMKIEQVPLPSDQPGGTILTPQDNSKVRLIAQQLHDDMKGFNLTHESKPYEDLLASNDSIFVAVYNDFNNLFASENKGTLRDWLKDEWSASKFWIPAYSVLVESIINRMDRLNLR